MSNTPAHGSDVQETPEWWKASDGRFYPPELHPNYVKPADPAPASSEPLPAERLRSDAGVGSTGTAAGAATDTVKDGMPLTSESMDPQATMPQTPAADIRQTVIQQPSMPPSPGAPQSMPPSMPPSPGAPLSPQVEQGPGGITYTAPVETVTVGGPGVGMPGAVAPMGTPAAPGMGIQPPATPPAKASSGTSGLIALIAGAAAIAGSLLQWGKGAVTGIDGVEKAIIEVPGFDSSGLITAVAGGVLILAGILFFMGVPKQTNWAVLAFLGGAVIVGTVVFSMIDIGDLSNRYAAQWQAEGLATTGDVISTTGDIGLWITGAAGVLGVLAAPFVRRS